MRPLLPLLLGVLLVGCPRAKVKLKSATPRPTPPARVLVVLPDTTAGIGDFLAEVYDMEAAGDALEQVGKTVARRTSVKRAGAADRSDATPIWSAPAPQTAKQAQVADWFEDALSRGIPGEATYRVVTATEALTALDCDYTLVLQTTGPEKGSVPLLSGYANNYRRAGSLYGRVLGIHGTKGAWQVRRCNDGEALGEGDLRYATTRLWWMLDLKKRHKIKIKDDPVGPLSEGLAGAYFSEVQPGWAAEVASWRAAGVSASAGEAIAGRSPAPEGDYASPFMADGSLAKWDLRVLAGTVAGAAAEEATKAAVRKVAGSNTLTDGLGKAGGALAGGLVQGSITRKLHADHYFDDVCDLAVWMDAAYAHRTDYLLGLHAAGMVYPELPANYRRCLQDAATQQAGAGGIRGD